MRALLVSALLAAAGCGPSNLDPIPSCNMTVNGTSESFVQCEVTPARVRPSNTFYLAMFRSDGTSLQFAIPHPGKFDCTMPGVYVYALMPKTMRYAGCYSDSDCTRVFGSCSMDITSIDATSWKGTVTAHLVSQQQSTDAPYDVTFSR